MLTKSNTIIKSLIFTLIMLTISIASCEKKVTPSSSFNPTSVSGAEQINIPISKIADGKAHFYKYTKNNIDIKFFVLKSSDGIFRAAFDACDVCWKAGKGYKQVGDNMICRNCGRAFASKMVNEIEGGCNPAPLKRKVINGNLEIKVTDIIAGSRFFQL